MDFGLIDADGNWCPDCGEPRGVCRCVIDENKAIAGCDHDWEELWDDEVGHQCCVCMICDEEIIFQYDVEKRVLEAKEVTTILKGGS